MLDTSGLRHDPRLRMGLRRLLGHRRRPGIPRRRGEDSIYKDGDRWRGAVSLGRTPDGRRRRIKVSGATKAEVIAKLKEVHRALDAGAGTPTKRLTVSAFLDRWVENLPGRVNQSTAADYADTVRLHLKPALGSKLLTKLSVSEVDALWTAKRKAGYAPDSIRTIRTVLRSALHQAKKEGLIVRNVAALSYPPKARQPRGPFPDPRRSEEGSSTPL